MKSIKIEKILALLPSSQWIGNDGVIINKVLKLGDALSDECTLMWCAERNIEQVYALKVGTVIVPSILDKAKVPNGINLIMVSNPRDAFRTVLNACFAEVFLPIINESAIIAPSTVLGKNCAIGHNVVIEEDCTIGESVVIGHNTVIHRNTKIENNVKIGSNCTIGGVGFGYEKDENGSLQLILHVGNVQIHSYAEIGNNTCIDRAVLGSTVIGKNVKIDNLVHIAHGVEIGENTLVIANAMIAGSVKIGKNVWVAPSSSIINGATVGDEATIGLGAVVLKPVETGKVVVGNPAKILHK